MAEKIIMLNLGSTTIVAEYIQDAIDKKIVISNPLELIQDETGISFKYPIWNSLSDDKVYIIAPDVICNPAFNLKEKYQQVLQQAQSPMQQETIQNENSKDSGE